MLSSLVSVLLFRDPRYHEWTVICMRNIYQPSIPAIVSGYLERDLCTGRCGICEKFVVGGLVTCVEDLGKSGKRKTVYTGRIGRVEQEVEKALVVLM